jgi:hypothetical protein
MAAPIGNMYALGNKGGRPPMFSDAESLEAEVISYFTHCSEKEKKATITGLALYLGFDSRQSLYDYETKQEFSYVIKRAKLAVENSYECNGTAMDIFALKNMGWKDQSQMDITSQEEKITGFNYLYPETSVRPNETRYSTK